MALGATGFIRRDRDAEVVDQVVLAVDFPFKPFYVRGKSLPGKVRFREHVCTVKAVAIQARAGVLVVVLCEISSVQLFCFICAARKSVAVQYVDYAVSVKILIRVRLPVAVEVPAMKPAAPSVPRAESGSGGATDDDYARSSRGRNAVSYREK